MTNANTNSRLLFSAEETAQMLGVSIKTVYRLLDRKHLVASNALRHKMISKKSIDNFIATTTS